MSRTAWPKARTVICATVAMAVMVCCGHHTRAQESFPFAIPGFDSTSSATNVANLDGRATGVNGPVAISGGHLTDGSGNRLRLLGVNFSFGANFPEHSDSEKVAAHLAKLGINAVRHHHMDNRDIWRRKSDGSREVDPDKLEKLAYLIAQLGKHGVYSNINLHVSRSVTVAEGFPDAEDLPRYNKYVLYLDERLKTFLKEYARTVLTYRNPHTGRRLADEPSLATVEITNENRFAMDGLKQLFSLPQRHQDEFTRRWNAYLKQKYKSTSELKRTWGIGSEPLGEDIADFRTFGEDAGAWSLNVRGGNEAQLRPNQPGPNNREEAVHVSIQKADGVTHQLEFASGGLTVQARKLYTLSFWIRAEKPRSVYVDVSQNGDPWQPVGMREDIEATASWQHIVRPFRATKTLEGKARWIFKLGDNDGDIYLAVPRIQVGGEPVPFDESWSLEDGTIPVPQTSVQESVDLDVTSCMEETERVFFEEMVHFLRDEIGVKAPITGSQARWQALSAFEPLDLVDAHAYWQHPQFPRTSWSSTDWQITNTSMLLSPGKDALSRLAWYRVWGRPYTVSEYNHPAPSDYQVECIPLLCAIAALQDWDGVYIYSYQHGSGSWDSDRIQSFFDINGNPAKVALLATGAMLFRRPDIKPAARSVTVGDKANLSHSTALQHRVGARLVSEADLKNLSSGDARNFVSDTRELCWNCGEPEKARFSVDTERTKLVVGFIAPGEAQLGGLQLKLGAASHKFGVVALTSLDGKPLATSHRMLLTTIANAHNNGMRWNDDRTSVANNWGSSPPMVEMVPAEIRRLRDDNAGKRCKVFALDPTGKRRAQVPATFRDRSIQFTADSSHRTIWYEIVCD